MYNHNTAMRATVYPENEPFDPITGDLLPEYRDAYLQGRLSPGLTQTIEAYLKRSPVQRGVVLGRYHELADEARRQGGTFVAPQWVQQQLIFQPTVSRMGPLRRPVVRVATGMFLALSVASVVQWIRNEPLVPAPVVAAVTRAATSASEATQRFVEQFTEAPVAETDTLMPAMPERVRRAVAVTKVTQRRPEPEPETLPLREAAIAPLSADSTTNALPKALPSTAGSSNSVTPSTATPVNAMPAPDGTVRGRITDERGRPLVGATVLVQGTQLAASTDASGEYKLDVPAGVTLQFGYGGYSDYMLYNAGPGTFNVRLQRSVTASRDIDR
ncbi:carboxypeptidase-like regulatory domain-containing protein [Hymenobacter weizhouensis]|uniref:carboxypeptidase-like regulatory domain-containing protein n=1 Tax=Hymenobacter sp. YIM 151500-1 TaxID=2987689 RepID=UPI0022260D6F|nr:carboxypeptidase-like regulatory domain-containing protein [Hymenobacter sp. YIM 151500-1]UYZ62003.1 carboxypeptidase-like regulatory domain-containing protein [Hymenobacter sp. YIM 151500-1]